MKGLEKCFKISFTNKKKSRQHPGSNWGPLAQETNTQPSELWGTCNHMYFTRAINRKKLKKCLKKNIDLVKINYILYFILIPKLLLIFKVYWKC